MGNRVSEKQRDGKPEPEYESDPDVGSCALLPLTGAQHMVAGQEAGTGRVRGSISRVLVVLRSLLSRLTGS